MKKWLLFLIIVWAMELNAQVVSTPFITALPIPVTLHAAADGRFFIACKGYNPGYPSTVKVYSASGVFENDLWDFTDSTETLGEKGVIGVCTDLNFTSNHYVYVCYNHLSPASIRIVRFTESGGIGSNPQLILNLPDSYPATYHTGGNIHMRPGDSSHLYLTVGDKAMSAQAQDTSTWNGKILRIGTDGSIPTDNPYYDDGNPASGNDDRIWAIGLRNSFDFTFSTLNDSLYATENGVSAYDELNLIEKGKNYGWPLCEGISGSCTGYEGPLEIFGAAVPALTGIIIYTGTLMPEITNHALIVDYNNGQITDIVLGNMPYYDQFVSRTPLTGTSFSSLTDIEQGLDGCIYVCEINAGKISRICDVTGLNEVDSKRPFLIYPNPSNSILHVEGPVNDLKILNMQGETVLVSEKNEIIVSSLKIGLYTVLVNGIYAYKLLHD